jgi:hypothetical protein
LVGVRIGPELTGDSRALERLGWSGAETADDPTGEPVLYISIILLGPRWRWAGSDPRKSEQHNKTRSNGRERVMNLGVLCLLLVSACLASLVDDHAQRSSARELLA